MNKHGFCRQRSWRNFTLIELLVVISIIAVVAALLMPAISKARNSAQGMACVSNLRQQGIAVGSYEADWHGWLPYRQYTSSIDWKGLLSVYINAKDNTIGQSYTGANRGVFKCPLWNRDLVKKYNKNDAWQFEGGYGTNIFVFPTLNGSSECNPKNISSFRFPSETIAIGDSTDLDTAANPWDYATINKPSNLSSNMLMAIGYRHNHGANVLWLDLHVQWMRFNTLVSGKQGTDYKAIDYYFLAKNR